MNDWLHSLPIVLLAGLVFGVTYVVAAAIYTIVRVLAVGERARAFTAVSPGMLPPLGILFGLFVAFTASQVWNDNDRATAAVNREASALHAVILLAASFPGDPESRLRALIRRHIEDAATREWPLMAKQTATLSIIPPSPLDEALLLTLTLTPGSRGQEIAQTQITTELQSALDARGQRILISRSQVHFIKWACLIAQAVCALTAIAFVHSNNRLAGLFMMGFFATGIAAAVLLIAAYDRPFIGQLAVGPDPLLQVMPEAEARQP
jgi:hypothetical protein